MLRRDDNTFPSQMKNNADPDADDVVEGTSGVGEQTPLV
jgi:hypothetical protein